MFDLTEYTTKNTRIKRPTKPLQDCETNPSKLLLKPIRLYNADGSIKERAKIVVFEYLGATNDEIRATVRKGGHWTGLHSELGYGVIIKNNIVKLTSPLDSKFKDGFKEEGETEPCFNIAIKDGKESRRIKQSEVCAVLVAIIKEKSYVAGLVAEKILQVI
jgi:hypothetical protein